ncbi:MAG: hypothetical protein KKB70_10515 [Proteobacteria bacterium]|nr:hypothetical protein [Pseudomonadota bacterium]MBU1568443.1 hypothetical protein [Pseudomonadota bacterium]
MKYTPEEKVALIEKHFRENNIPICRMAVAKALSLSEQVEDMRKEYGLHGVALSLHAAGIAPGYLLEIAKEFE